MESSGQPHKNEFTTSELARIVGIPERKVLSFVERGYISPSLKSASGPGSRRLWSFADLLRCALVALLSRVLSVEALRQVALFAMENDRALADNAVWYIPLDGEVDKPKFIVELRQGGLFKNIKAIPEDKAIPSLPGAFRGEKGNVENIDLHDKPAYINIDMGAVRYWIDRRMEQ